MGAPTHLYPLDLTLRAARGDGAAGATQAGKTTLMRVMAGLDAPTPGRVLRRRPRRDRHAGARAQRRDGLPAVHQLPVDDGGRQHRLAAEAARRPNAAIAARVHELAAKLHIEPFLKRLPAELSGGQQQRVALARALAKKAPLMLLDEPLVNLDYKLREELREELTQLFASGDSTVVYATTEPTEALLLGGYTAVLDAGELLQYGPTAEVFHRPKSIRVARAFSDPPMNLIAGQAARRRRRAARRACALPVPLPAGAHRHGADGRHARQRAARAPRAGDVALPGTVELAEISGSDTFVHVDTAVGELVAQLTGVHVFDARRADHAVPEPGAGLRVRRRAATCWSRRAARREALTWPASTSTWRTPTGPNPQRDEDYALLPLKMTFDDGGAYALLGPSGCGKTTLLNIISGLVTPSQGTVRFDGRDVTRADAAAAQHRPGVPVPGDLRHDDGGREPGLPAAQPRRGARAQIKQRVGQIAEMLELSAPARPARRRPGGRREAEDLARPRPGARGRVRGAVRRAADGDRPAPEVAAAAQAQADPPRAEADADLRHARPGRGADLRRPGGGDDARPRGADRQRVASCSSGRAHTFVGHFIGSPGMNFLPARAAAARVAGHGCRRAGCPTASSARRAARVRDAGRAGRRRRACRPR